MLKAQTKTVKTVNSSQWKRKQSMKGDKCDICSRTFTNSQGVNLHKKRVHGSGLSHIRRLRDTTELTRSDSVKSANEGSRPSSPSPKKVHMDDKENNVKVNKIQVKEITIGSEGASVNVDEMEQSGNINERGSDQKVDMGIQCTLKDLIFPQTVKAGLMTKLENNLKMANIEIN